MTAKPSCTCEVHNLFVPSILEKKVPQYQLEIAADHFCNCPPYCPHTNISTCTKTHKYDEVKHIFKELQS